MQLPDELVRSAKALALEQGTTLTRVIEDALRRHLAPDANPAPPFEFQPVVKRGRLRPGVDLNDRDSLFDRMEGRD